MASYEIDSELGQLGDMPLYDAESKYFLADFHEVNTLPYVEAKVYTVDLDQPPSIRWKEVITAHLDVLPRVHDYLEALGQPDIQSPHRPSVASPMT